MSIQIKPTACSLILTEDCNLACKYCFELEKRTTKKMSKDVAKKSIDLIVKNAIEQKNDTVEIMFFGGEPFLNVDVLFFCAEYIKEIKKDKKINFNTSIITNGTLYTEEIEDVIFALSNVSNLSIQISIDGTQKNHDKNRVFKSGDGSFSIVKKNAKKFIRFFEFIRSNNKICLHGCLVSETLNDLFDSYAELSSIGDCIVWMMPIHTTTYQEGDSDVYKAQLQKIYSKLELDFKNGDEFAFNRFSPFDNCIKKNPNQKRTKPCGAGYSFVSFNTVGDIYPCHSFYFRDTDQSSIIGTLNNGFDYSAMKKYADCDTSCMSCVKEKECSCTNCYICISDNFYVNGDILKNITGERCLMSHVEKEFEEKILSVTANILDDQKKSHKPDNVSFEMVVTDSLLYIINQLETINDKKVD